MSDPGPRLGVIGTGVWARSLHLPAAAASPSVQLAAVFGRRAEAVAPIASEYGVTAFTDLGAFLDSVDMVAIAVTPEAQPALASAVAASGTPALLEKPVALDPRVAHEVATAFESRGVPSPVFFAQLLMPRVADWVAELRARGGWRFGRLESFSRVLVDQGNPFHDTPWRASAGALWDTGPHAVAMATAVLGPVEEVSATAGPGDLRSLTLRHPDAVSTIALAMDAAHELPGETAFFGDTGKQVMPPAVDWNAEARAAFERALESLIRAVDDPSHPVLYDARFGARVTAALDAAATSVRSGRRVRLAG
ncbi:Gfo/Idh/MocA family protein [Herbiconiux sp. P17]|uniref:Gfo/Idh/MocA family protein n=1 Tax=Herbiconiux wuyangfengii TaxID=3342794 RepID=UPI0035BB865C